MSTDVARLSMCPGVGCSGTTVDRGILCQTCWAYRAALLAGLQQLWPMAHAFLQPSSRLGQRVTGGAGPASRAPLNSLVLETIESTLALVVGWASTVRVIAGLSTLPGLGTARPDWLFAHALPTLHTHDYLIVGRDAVDYYGDLYRAHRTLSRLTHLDMRETERIDAVCPSCSRMTLVSRDYRDCVACLTCGSKWGQAAWHAQLAGK